MGNCMLGVFYQNKKKKTYYNEIKRNEMKLVEMLTTDPGILQALRLYCRLSFPPFLQDITLNCTQHATLCLPSQIAFLSRPLL